MSTSLRVHAQDYLAMRRALGFKLTSFGTDLFGFIAYLEQRQEPVITTELAVAWARATPRSVGQVRVSRRMMVARLFARYVQVFEPATQVPAPDILNHHYCRRSPHLYTPDEVAALMAATDCLRPQLRRETYRTLIGLLSVTGLRTSEARRLDEGDVDLKDGLLLVKDSKFGKSRDVPLHESAVAALQGYARIRDRLRHSKDTPAFLISGRGRRLSASDLNHTFNRLREQADVGSATGARHPRWHDFRHSFATATLIDWYRDGEDVQAKLPLLSTYLGHADPKSTYWYLTGSPELLELAANRMPVLTTGGDSDE